MKVLFVIDNVIQYERIKKLLSEYARPDVEFEFRHSSVKSPLHEHPDFKGNVEKCIDVKKDYPSIIGKYDLVFSVHCFQLFPAELVKAVRCINVHPGYNPINRGWYPQVFAIINGLPVGATIHEMDEQLDHGPVIAREFVPIYSWDTSESVYHRILEKEMELFERHLDAMLDHTYTPIQPGERGNLFLKKDFLALCEIPMDEQVTYRECINRLRALTHGDYANAYFVDEQTGEKVYVKMQLYKK